MKHPCLVFTDDKRSFRGSDGLSIGDARSPFAPSSEVRETIAKIQTFFRPDLPKLSDAQMVVVREDFGRVEERYRAEMRDSFVKAKTHWRCLLEMPTVTLLCDCLEPRFCHRYLLAKFLGKCGALNMGERRPPHSPHVTDLLPGKPGDVFAAIDVEKADPQADSVCEVGIVVYRGDKIVFQDTSLVRPPRSKVTNTFVHGLTWKDLQDKPTFDAVWYRYLPWLYRVDYLVAHHAVIETQAFDACAKLYDLPTIYQPHFADTLKMAKHIWPELPKHGLKELCASLGITLDNHHRALPDALACGQLVLMARTRERKVA